MTLRDTRLGRFVRKHERTHRFVHATWCRVLAPVDHKRVASTGNATALVGSVGGDQNQLQGGMSGPLSQTTPGPLFNAPSGQSVVSGYKGGSSVAPTSTGMQYGLTGPTAIPYQGPSSTPSPSPSPTGFAGPIYLGGPIATGVIAPAPLIPGKQVVTAEVLNAVGKANIQ